MVTLSVRRKFYSWRCLMVLAELSLGPPLVEVTPQRSTQICRFQKPIPSVANAIKLLQACFYKSVNTGLFLTSLSATSIAKFILLMLHS